MKMNWNWHFLQTILLRYCMYDKYACMYNNIYIFLVKILYTILYCIILLYIINNIISKYTLF